MAEIEGLRLNILSPERRLISGEKIEWISLPTSEGLVQVLSGHAPMIGTLETGIYTFHRPDGREESGFVTTGFFEVTQDEVTVTAEVLELEGEIDLERAREAQKRAEAKLQDPGGEESEFRKQALKLQRALIRQQFARKGY